MKKRITLIGCGQIGSRHLQAIAKLAGAGRFSIEMQIVEPAPASEMTGKQRLLEISKETEAFSVEWLKDLSDVEGNTDLTIVATTAKGRVGLINELLQRGHRRFLIEKMVCQSTGEYEDLLKAMSRHDAKGWVHCPFRYFDFYRKVRNTIDRDGRIVLNVTGGNLGLGCTAIHYLDLFLYFLRDGHGPIELDGSRLSALIPPSKRGRDFVEFSGTLTANTGDHFASISFLSDHQAPAVLNFTGANLRFWVDESCQGARVAAAADNWDWRNWDFKYQHTSDLSAVIVKDLFDSDNCLLPTLAESYHVHKELFRVFTMQLLKVHGIQPRFCPIT